jgi:hypothetical protein
MLRQLLSIPSVFMTSHIRIPSFPINLWIQSRNGVYMSPNSQRVRHYRAHLLHKSHDRPKELDSKVFDCAGSAIHELADYQAVKTMLNGCSQLSPQDMHEQRELKRTVCRITEKQYGHCDFRAISENIASAKDCRARQASHVRPTYIRKTEGHGNGLFAT